MKDNMIPIIVVEGKTDVQFLSTFLDAEFVITNGSDVPSSLISYLKNESNKRKIIVLTDPDYPGKQIRDKLDKEINNLYHAYVRKEYSIKKNKVGVAESTKEEILNALNHLDLSYESKEILFDMSFLLENGLVGPNSSSKRKYLLDKLHLGECNVKTMLKRLNRSEKTPLEVIKILEEYHD